MFPALATPELAKDREVITRMRGMLENFPMGVPDFLEGQRRYLQAIREFAASHPDVIPIDAYQAFQKLVSTCERFFFANQVTFDADQFRH